MRHGCILLGKTKNGERRGIPINHTLRETLKGITRRLDVPYVFYDAHTGKRYKGVYRSFYRACKKVDNWYTVVRGKKKSPLNCLL